ncbi:MAG: DVU0298 family protein [Dissulfurispiraceae bacterium]
MSKLTPECPYCGKYISQPVPTRTEFVEIISGKCECGAVYVCDPTGHNVGEAYGDAMALATGQWNIGELGPDSYDMKEMFYNLKSHSRMSAKGLNMQCGKLIFIKMGRLEDKVQVEKQRADPDSRSEDPAVIGMKLKDQVRYFLEKGCHEAVGRLAVKDKNVIKWLTSFSYDKEDNLTWRAIEAMGHVVRELGRTRLDVVRETVRKLLWSMSDESGGIGWSAPEFLGEIIRSDPDEFTDIVPILWSNREEPSFRPGVLWAMVRVAGVRPDLISVVPDQLAELADDPNPTVRGYTALLSGGLSFEGKGELLKKLSEDSSVLNVYTDGTLKKVTVAELAKKAYK